MQTIVCIAAVQSRLQQTKHSVQGMAQILEVPSWAQIAIIFHDYYIT